VEGWARLEINPGLHTYKLQLVPLFREAWENGYTGPDSNPRLTGDAMGGTISERWPGWFEKPRHRETFNRMTCIWDEWVRARKDSKMAWRRSRLRNT
jgi:hypothetical protein